MADSVGEIFLDLGINPTDLSGTVQEVSESASGLDVNLLTISRKMI